MFALFAIKLNSWVKQPQVGQPAEELAPGSEIAHNGEPRKVAGEIIAPPSIIVILGVASSRATGHPLHTVHEVRFVGAAGGVDLEHATVRQKK